MFNKENELYEGYIYLITNKINGKQYVGQTQKKPIYRFNEHASVSNKSNMAISKAIKKYGKDNFTFEIIEKIYATQKDELVYLLNQSETKYISIYNTYKGNGYNSTSGGDSCKHLGVPVDKYDLNGNYICSYETLLDAGKSVDTNGITSIIQVCNGVRNTCKGFVWRYHGENFDKFSIDNKQYKHVDIYSSDCVLIKTVDSISEAAEYLGVNISTVSACCNGRIHLIKEKYVCRYTNDSFYKYDVFTSAKKAINVFNYKKELVYSFDSIKETADFFTTTPITISEACRGIGMTIKGFVFRYAGDSYDLYKVKFRECCQYDKDKKLIAQYKSQSEASRMTGISLTTIQKCCAGKQLFAGDYIFKPINVAP